nr:MAG TPA: hypothetical protein [Crassvirales sp.]
MQVQFLPSLLYTFNKILSHLQKYNYCRFDSCILHYGEYAKVVKQQAENLSII